MTAETSSGELWRVATVWTLIVLGAVVMVLSTLNTWVERRMLDTDTWVETSTDLLNDDAVRQEVSVRLVNALYENVDVGGAIDDRLPEPLKGVGVPLAGVMRNPLVETADRLMQTEQMRAIWEEANRVAHSTVVAVLEDNVNEAVSTAGGVVVIDLSEALRLVGEQIGIPEGILDAIPEEVGTFEVVELDQLEQAQTSVRIVKLLSTFYFVLVLALFVGAIYLAADWRRRAVLGVGLATAIGGFVVLVVLRFGIGFFAGKSGTEGGRAAVESVLAIGTALLRQMAWSEIVIGLLVALGASLVGPARYAQWVRSHLAGLFRRNPAATWIGLVVVILFALIVLPFSTSSWLTTLIVLVLVVIGVEMLRRTSLAEDDGRRTEEVAAMVMVSEGEEAVIAVEVDSGYETHE